VSVIHVLGFMFGGLSVALREGFVVESVGRPMCVGLLCIRRWETSRRSGRQDHRPVRDGGEVSQLVGP